MSVDLKAATPDTTIAASSFLFGADTQAAGAPSVFAIQNVIDYIGTAFASITSSGIVQAGTTLGISTDVLLSRDAAAALALRNSTTAQTFRVYNTYTDASNYERARISWSSNELLIGTESAGTGSGRPMSLQTPSGQNIAIKIGGTYSWYFDGSSQHFKAVSDNTFDIGATGTTRPRSAYFAASISVAEAVATPAGGSTSARLLLGSTAGLGIYFGSGAPTVSAAKGSLYIRSDGSGVADRFYVNTNGITTWTNFVTAA